MPGADPLMLGTLEKVQGAELKDLRQRCLVLMRHDGEPTKFPGAQPVSFERRHLTAGAPSAVSLLTSPYFAAEKTDGVRYMLLILGARGAFTVDRNFDMRRLPGMRFPCRDDPDSKLDATLLDGELVIDAHATADTADPAEANGASSGASRRLRFLAYDACCVANKPCIDESLCVPRLPTSDHSSC